MNIQADTFDDLLKLSLEEIFRDGKDVETRRKKSREIIGATLELTNPLARLSIAEGRSTLFSCLGEWLWYMGGCDRVDQMTYYAPSYSNEVEAQGGKVVGAYGPRLRRWDGIDQIENVIKLLTAHKTSRRAVIQLFDRSDLADDRPEVPCTCTLQFLCRDDRLNMVTMMRSNDAVLGLPHDVFAFTMLQELIARSIGVGLGVYRHWVGSLHIYEKNETMARNIVAEGWQQTRGVAMDPMPADAPLDRLEAVLEAEREFRQGRADPWPNTSHEYWDGLIWLLEWRRHKDDAARREEAWQRRPVTTYDPWLRRNQRPLHEASA